MTEVKSLRRGIYAPLPTFFDQNEDLDIQVYQQHIRRLAETDVAGHVVMGSNGEAVHLDEAERVTIVSATREAAGSDALILAGCGEQGTRATIRNCQNAARAGADFALILPPFFFKGRMTVQALQAHYQAVADASPIPIVIYNMPANTAGLDLSAATICGLAVHPNIVGLKDSAGDMGKLAQIIDQSPQGFAVFAGSAGYLLPALAIGASGAVAALANIFPRQVCQLQDMFEKGQLEEAASLQRRLAPANTAVTGTYGVPGLKAALELTAGYGGLPRSPLQALDATERKQLSEIIGAMPMIS